ncbi:methyltransferase [Streptomyces tanashiensis]|uniref:methyltransferase n=1 Tax=Streptomyces tanashiensis TaxID=67367 RepID=UPI0033EB6A11
MSIEHGLALLRLNEQRDASVVQFSLLGRDWELLPGVFSPTACFSTKLFASWLSYAGVERFLEIGSGAGVIAVTAAIAGCRSVTAVDIDSAAVENTLRNARRHGVSNRVECFQGDLFSALPESNEFDLIFWNSNFIEPPSDFALHTPLRRAIFDPGYEAHDRFLREAPGWLSPQGRLFLGFSDLGNTEHLRELAATQGLSIRMERSASIPYAQPIEYQLVELARKSEGS